MDVVIETLIVDEHRLAHIARHQVTIEEVQEVIAGDYAFIRGRQDRWLLIGKTKQGRFLTVVVGERAQRHTYGLVTARPSSREERSFYLELALEQDDEESRQSRQGGEQDEQS